jgi:RHS repeat-associated protein
MKKRIASVLVALVMVLSLVPKTSWAWTSTVTTLEQLKSAMSELSYNNTIEIVVSGTIEISETLNIRPTRTTNGSMAWYEYYNQRVVISGADANSKLVRAEGFKGSLFNLTGEQGYSGAGGSDHPAYAALTLKDITVDGGFRRLLPEITYATHEYDDVLNQFYAKARMYDAENKRFDAVDPVKGFIADPTTLVQYLYVEDNAVNQVDPTGRIPLMAVGALAGGIINAAVTAYQSKKETGHISISKTAVSFVEGAITGATLGSNLGAVAVGVISGVTAAAASVARDKIDNSNGGKISKWQMATNAIVSGVVSGVTAGLIGGPGAKAPITRTGIKIVNQQFGMGTVKSFITQPTQRVISKNFAMGVVKTAIIAPINAAISSNVIKKLSEVSAVSLTDAKKASVTNSNATNNNYFMKVACTH